MCNPRTRLFHAVTASPGFGCDCADVAKNAIIGCLPNIPSSVDSATMRNRYLDSFGIMMPESLACFDEEASSVLMSISCYSRGVTAASSLHHAPRSSHCPVHPAERRGRHDDAHFEI